MIERCWQCIVIVDKKFLDLNPERSYRVFWHTCYLKMLFPNSVFFKFRNYSFDLEIRMKKWFFSHLITHQRSYLTYLLPNIYLKILFEISPFASNKFIHKSTYLHIRKTHDSNRTHVDIKIV